MLVDQTVHPYHQSQYEPKLSSNDPHRIIDQILQIWGHEAAAAGISCGSIMVIRRRSAASNILDVVVISTNGPFLGWGISKQT